MGLAMSTKRQITAVTVKRYHTADKKGKTNILDGSYALHLLANRGNPPWRGLTARPSNSRPERPRNDAPAVAGPSVYTQAVITALYVIWATFDLTCGKRAGPVHKIGH
jgi:hypothetical protein